MNTSEARKVLSKLKALEIDPQEAVDFIFDHLPRKRVTWTSLVTAHLVTGNRQHSQQRHLASALASFGEHLKKRGKADSLGRITQDDVKTWLARWQGDGSSPKTYSEKFFYLKSAFNFAEEISALSLSPMRGMRYLRRDPAEPQTLNVQQAREIMETVERDHPQYVGYFSLCMFGGMRPDPREGEAHRLHQDLLAGRAFTWNGRLKIRGKGHSAKTRPRYIKLETFGPLREWLEAYPITQGLFPPGMPLARYEREITKIRRSLFPKQPRKNSNNPDEHQRVLHNAMRHTAATAMLRQPKASFVDVADAFGNSETSLRAHYWNSQWTLADTQEFYNIRPQKVVPFPQIASHESVAPISTPIVESDDNTAPDAVRNPAATVEKAAPLTASAGTAVLAVLPFILTPNSDDRLSSA